MLYIKPLTETDHPQLCELILANSERLNASFPVTLQAFTNTDGGKAFVTERVMSAAQKESYYFLIRTEPTGGPVGVLSIKQIDKSIPKAELAYFIDKAHEGRGIITEGLKWLADYAFNEADLARVYVRVHPDNTGSRRVAEKAGFVQEGVMRHDSRDGDGRLCDAVYYGLTKD